MELSKLKVKSVRRLGITKVNDLTVDDVQHYITENGVVNHNTGIEYAASIILILTKAKLNDGNGENKTQVGNIVTCRPNKNRFAKPQTIKIHLRYDKGMNEFIGLEEYLNWETVGIGKGTILSGVEYDKLKGDKKKVSKQYTTDDGEIFHYIPDEKSKTIAVKHLNTQVKSTEFYTKEVFTEDIINKLDEIIKPLFNYGSEEEIPDEDLFEMEAVEIEENEETED